MTSPFFAASGRAERGGMVAGFQRFPPLAEDRQARPPFPAFPATSLQDHAIITLDRAYEDRVTTS